MTPDERWTMLYALEALECCRSLEDEASGHYYDEVQWPLVEKAKEYLKQALEADDDE